MTLKPDFSDKTTLEKYSSAFSLSDMEIFVFPELMFPLVIANIMSPILWEWRSDPWFKDIHKKTHNYKVNRIKQFIMDHFVFNLDLDTWGLTQKDKEIARFSHFINMDILRQSNALFGYEGDKYYFDMDIRKHFGLDKYTTETIPYWKTETLEAMTAFRYKDSFTNGAGECVSLSALYAAALFVVGRIPLENIFLISTPLHSQNFIDGNEGMLTNNRRIVTKNMWFNGTAMSAKARRALENEKVTIVSHVTGYIHHVFSEATIDPEAYQRFAKGLTSFLTTTLSPAIFVNFLRYHMSFKKCFQYRHTKNGRVCYVGLETIFEYEHQTKYNFSEASRESLLNEIDEEEFQITPLEHRLIVQDVEEFLENNKGITVDETKAHFVSLAKTSQCNNQENIEKLFTDLERFLNVQPQLPSTDKHFKPSDDLKLNVDLSRDEIIKLIHDTAKSSETALLALYAYRQMDLIDWKPYVKAALERNPVAVEGLRGKTPDEAYQMLQKLPNESIYEGKRLAQPDEVWNFGRGDGLEKAMVMANYLYHTKCDKQIDLQANKSVVTIKATSGSFTFQSGKELEKQLDLAELLTYASSLQH